MHTNVRGFTLVELIVVMAVFTVVITIAASSFNTILRHSSSLAKSEESNIEGVIGLEIFRHDLEQTGFGLPWSFPATSPTYSEATESPANKHNESTNSIPRAIVAANDLAVDVLAGTDYLVLKATTLGRSSASQRWSYVNYSSTGRPPKKWQSGNLATDDRVIVLKRSFTDSGVTNQLVFDTTATGKFYTKFPDPSSDTRFPAPFSPFNEHEIFTIYGVDSGDLRMPFNRSDYFIERPGDISSQCAPATGILYKGVVNQTGGTLTKIPILDCIADMQVVFGWDFNGDGLIDTYSDADGTNVNGGTLTQVQDALKSADGIRDNLKLIKVYILAQEGKRDPSYTNSNSTILVGSEGEGSLSKNYNLALEQLQYRWKVYRIVVRPKNLSAQ